MFLIVAYAVALVSIGATALLAHVVLNYRDKNPDVQNNRSRKIEGGFLAFLLLLDFMIVYLIKGYGG